MARLLSYRYQHAVSLFLRRWCFQLCLMLGLCFLAIYTVTQTTFEPPMNLNRPKSIRRHEENIWQEDIHLHVKGLNPPARVPVEAADGNFSSQDRSQNDFNSSFMMRQERIQLQRHRHLARACRRRPELSKGALSGNTLRHIYVHERHKLLYCFVPKVGCSNWKRVLMVLGGLREGTADISSNEAHYTNGMKRLSAYNITERAFRLDTYASFMYARQPFMRALSAYRNKFADLDVFRNEPYFRHRARSIMRRYRKGATEHDLQTGEGVTWLEWVSYLTNASERRSFDDHWQEVYKMCSPCRISYDYLGKLETVSDDARYMLASLELDDKASYPANGNSHPTNSSKTYEDFFGRLSKDHLQKLWDVYEIDFDLFGYSKPTGF